MELIQAVIELDFRRLKELANAKPLDKYVLTDYDGTPVLHLAIIMGFTKAVKLLLLKGIDLSLYDAKSTPPLHFAVSEERQDCFDLLLQAGVDINEVEGHFGQTALHFAVAYSKPLFVQKLIEKGANLEAKDFQGKTPLRLGCERCYTSEKIRCIKLLLEHGADVDTIDNAGNNPILNLVQAGNYPCVSLLVKHGAGVNMADDHGRTPLFYAVNGEDFQTVELLLQSGNANPNQKDNDGFVPLHEAVCQESYRCVKILLDNGADVNLPDARGNSPLHFSCIEGFHKMATVLLGYGAKRDLKNSFGETPLSLARRNNHEQCVTLLRRPRSLKVEVGQIFTQVEDEEQSKSLELDDLRILGAGAKSPLPSAMKREGSVAKKVKSVDMPSPTPRSVAPTPTFADEPTMIAKSTRPSKGAAGTPRHSSLPPQRSSAGGGTTPRKGAAASSSKSKAGSSVPGGATPRSSGPPSRRDSNTPRPATAPKRSSGSSAAPARGHAQQSRHGSVKASSSNPAGSGVYSTLPKQRGKASELAELPEADLPPGSTPPTERKQKMNAVSRFFRKLFR
eukprot:TRINITY_DN631_c0_g1_i2.p1 TRINITY_DN631_c0_g1~~TRINITY_DN631_c0_g1_i2.p1  ORF type:complete len:564 (-),score=118.21 TRINITY_DN631_c0_g1_i2:179-1870(-)